jgi:hypothetical protein
MLLFCVTSVAVAALAAAKAAVMLLFCVVFTPSFKRVAVFDAPNAALA